MTAVNCGSDLHQAKSAHAVPTTYVDHHCATGNMFLLHAVHT